MTAAPLSRRFLAGLIDGIVLLSVCIASFLGPILVKGVVLPMWGVLAAIVGLQVVPLAFLRKTLGYRIMGLELVTEDGHEVDIGNVLFREMVGRGLFPMAFLYTVFLGLFASALGIVHFAMPQGLALIMFLTCAGASLVAIGGQLYALGTKEGRTLADLMARSHAVEAPARPLPDDPDDRAELLERRRLTLRNVLLFQVALVVGVIALPWVLTMQVGESSQAHIERIKREALAKKFESDPASESTARELMQMLRSAGLQEESKEVLRRYGEAQKRHEVEREMQLRAQLAKNPQDENALSSLLDLLVDAERYDDAKTAYLAWLGPTPTASRRGGYGNWLASNGLNEDAEVQFRQALSEDPLIAMGHTMFGILLQRREKLPEAQEEIFLALLDDAEDEDALDSQRTLNSALGPLSTEKQNQLRARYASWKRDAGVK